MPNLITVKRVLGPTIGRKKPLLSATNKDKENILKQIKADWRELLRLHFLAEGSISGSKVTPWKSLTQQHLQYKDDNGFLTGILEMSTPTLLTRYQKNIKYSTKDFKIYIQYPVLQSGYRGTNQQANAGVHQLGRVKRRIFIKDFKESARNRTIKYLSGI